MVQTEVVSEIVPEYPALQRQSDTAVECGDDAENRGQAVRKLATPRQKKSAVQIWHAPLASAKYPGKHTHAPILKDPVSRVCVKDFSAEHNLRIPESQNVSFSQSIHSVAPGSCVLEYVPSPHVRQTSSATADGMVECFPTSHRVHGALPGEFLYEPAGQARQVLDAIPVNPLLHVQLLMDGLPITDCEFGSQAWHVSMCTAALAPEYVPAGQSTHAASTELVA